MSATNTRTFTARFQAATQGFESQVRRVSQSLGQVDRVAEKTRRALKRVDDVEVDPQIKIRTERVDKSIAIVKRRIESLERQAAELPIDADPLPFLRDIQKAESALGRLERQAGSLRLQAEGGGAAGGGRGGIGALLAGAGGGLAAAAGPVAAVGAAAAAVLAPLALVGGAGLKAGVQIASSMEQAEIQLRFLTGSTEKAQATVADVKKLADTSPFEFPELLAARKNLLAFGFSTDKSGRLLRTLGNVSAATGADLGDISVIFGQINAKGKLQNEELLQLQERGIPVYQVLAEKLGITAGEVNKLASEGKLGAENLGLLVDGLDKGTKTTPKFSGALEALGNTTSGKLSTLKDTINGALGELGKAVAPVVVDLVDQATPTIRKIGEWLKTNQEKVKAWAGIIAGSAVVVGGWALKIAGYLLQAQAKVYAFQAGVVGALATFVGALAKVPIIGDKFKGVEEKLRDVQTGLQGASTGAESLGRKAVAGGDAMILKGQQVVDKYQVVKQNAELAGNTARAAGLKAASGSQAAARQAAALRDRFEQARLKALGVASATDALGRKSVTIPVTYQIRYRGQPALGGGRYGYLAEGGPAQAMRAYVVGERGPELFLPSSGGTVVSNRRVREAVGTQGTGSVLVTNHVYLDGREIRAVARSETTRVTSQMARAVATGVGEVV